LAVPLCIGDAALPYRREDAGLALTVTEYRHFTILTYFQGYAIPRREQGGAGPCALCGCSGSTRLENTTYSSNCAVPINYYSAIKCRTIASQLWREIAQWTVDEQARV
jgi:hypothetical protein